MLIQSGLRKKYWAEAVNTAVYLKNRSPTKALSEAMPEQAWSGGDKVNLSHLRVFYNILPSRDSSSQNLNSLLSLNYCVLTCKQFKKIGHYQEKTKDAVEPSS
jgi:hypothetical protein